MEDQSVNMILFITFALDVAVGFWASSWGRSGFGWFLGSLLVSVIITVPLLLICGKTLEKKAEEMKLIKQMAE